MSRVSLIFTVHREYGLASVSRLEAILERMQPEVIFLEVSPASLEQSRQGAGNALEPTAALRYSARHQVDLVPVDHSEPSPEFYLAIQYVFGRIEDANPEIAQLEDRYRENTSANGFSYLNSRDSVELRSQIDRATQITLAELHDPELYRLYEQWTGAHAVREIAMLRCIEEYAERHRFAKAVFLVGSAHQQSILKRLGTGTSAPVTVVHWDTEPPRERS